VEAEALTAPAGARWLRWGAWAFLAMILAGLALVWLTFGRGGGRGELPRIARVPDFSLVERSGGTVTRQDLLGTPWVADFIFTRCQLSCPLMTARMADLGEDLGRGVRRVSVSVDPEHDTPEVLAEYAETFHAGDDWLFLTGDPESVQELVVDGFHLGLGRAVEDSAQQKVEPISHSTRFVLVGPGGWIRGYYDGFDAGALSRLVEDARALAGAG
jgi:protein SCO1/2